MVLDLPTTARGLSRRSAASRRPRTHATRGLLPPGSRDGSGPQAAGQWQRWVQLEVTLGVSLHPPEVTGPRVSGVGWAHPLAYGLLPRGLEVQLEVKEPGRGLCKDG